MDWDSEKMVDCSRDAECDLASLEIQSGWVSMVGGCDGTVWSVLQGLVVQRVVMCEHCQLSWSVWVMVLR